MILLCGKNGQLGRALAQSLSPLGSLHLWGREDADLGKPGLEKKLLALNPKSVKAVVNAAAFTKVDLAEKEKDAAFRINRDAVKTLSEYARDIGAFFIHFSSDYVYDGKKEGFYTEEDAPHPLNVYGESKLAGDIAVMETKGLKYLIFRTSWVYGLIGKNFPRTVIKLSQKELGEILMDSTQIGAPTSAEFLASVTALALKNALEAKGVGPELKEKKEVPTGLYHLVNGGETTWLAFARHLVNKAYELGFKNLRLRPEDIRERAEEDLSRPARRPLNSKLSTLKFQRDFKIVPPHFLFHADLFLENLKALEEEFRLGF
jgi:dTDP-4-dehydrorhamnose reductase